MNGDFIWTAKANALTPRGRQLYKILDKVRREWQLEHKFPDAGFDMVEASADFDDATMDDLYREIFPNWNPRRASFSFTSEDIRNGTARDKIEKGITDLRTPEKIQ